MKQKKSRLEPASCAKLHSLAKNFGFDSADIERRRNAATAITELDEVFGSAAKVEKRNANSLRENKQFPFIYYSEPQYFN